MPSLLFVCIANSFRSQMAEALAKSLAPTGWEIWSAGSHPSGQVHPLAVQLMQELKCNLQGHRSKGLEELPKQRWDYVVTMGCGDACPMLSAVHRLDWSLPDPAGLGIEESRRVRDEINRRVRALIGNGT